MELSRNEAIKECKELWRLIKKSRKSKWSFLHITEDGKTWAGKDYASDCPLCEWVVSGGKSGRHKNRRDTCWHYLLCSNCKRDCPLWTQYGKTCFQIGFMEDVKCPNRWFIAIENLKEE